MMAGREKRVAELKSRDAVVDAAVQYIDGMAQDGVAVKRISSNGVGEMGRSVKFMRMLAERGIK